MATQNTIPPFKSGTVTDALLKDHREIESYYNEVINSNDHDHQERYANQFTWELARHSVAEELIIYPAFEKYLGTKGHEMAERDRKEHHEVKEQLKKFQNMKPKNPEFIPTLKSLMSNLSQHIKEEESMDIPALEKVLSEDHNYSGVSEKLAKNFGRTKAFVPSRSHPSAGENPPFESVMGLLTAPLDHISDIFRKFPDKTINPNPSTK
ncbi:HHE domain-containing protein [Sporormia fimetaria CBS 119925]|uniref:HHE domain-containing protein n=1 Tax=Sporormia fimetaria CBS 119925 TaxID=1340428 RepID=A0A6A6VPY8_9PLEO|nr:HHE domain-containing protein [Sporormia fimetaria CBS 119925]